MSTAIVKLRRPHVNQIPIIEATNRFIVVMAGRRFGKSILAPNILIAGALRGEKWAYLTPNNQLSRVFYKEFESIIPSEIAKTNKQDLWFDFITNGSIRFFSGESIDNLRGLKFHGIFIDEASYIKELQNAWNKVLRPTLTDYMGRAYFVSTPRGKEFFYSRYLINDGEWKSFKYTTYDNPYINKGEIESAKRELPPEVFAQEYMADPSENAANPFGIANIDKNIRKMSSLPVAAWGIDLAKSFDYTVIHGLDKFGETCYHQRFQNDWDYTEAFIKNLPPAPMLIDQTGVGDPIVERLQHQIPYVTGFKFSASSKQNLMKGLVADLHQGNIKYPDGVIVDELKSFEYEYTSTGVKYTAPSGFHDDCVMALALAAKHFRENGNPIDVESTVFNPLRSRANENQEIINDRF